ncbi:MAG: hydroxymethylbilane synthase [Ferruginibacter sp.]
MNSIIRIGTRESELAVWQATLVKNMLAEKGYSSTLVYIKSEGDIDLKTPLYEMGVQGIFTRSLDIALLNNNIDIAVHSMKDVPTQLPVGIVQAAVLKRGNYKDLFVGNRESAIGNRQSGIAKIGDTNDLIESLKLKDLRLPIADSRFTVATSSIRRKAQWLHRYPNASIENLRGNVNTRLKKVAESNWDGAIFAAAGLERIGLRPENAVELDWMLPAPAQGAIMVVCREADEICLNACAKLNDEATEICTKIERDFLRELLGGCSTPISALGEMNNDEIHFIGNILSIDGKEKAEVEKIIKKENAAGAGKQLAIELLKNGGQQIADSIRNAK